MTSPMNTTKNTETMCCDKDNYSQSTLKVNRSTVTATLLSLVENNSFADVIFVFGNEEKVPAHQLILAARSTVFSAMFYGPSKMTNKEVYIEDISVDTFKMMLLYIYTDQVPLFQQNAIEILYAAHKYDLEMLQEKCENYIKAEKKPANALMLFGKLYKVEAFFPLKMDLIAYICENFYEKFNDPLCFTVIDDVNTLKYLIEKLSAINHPDDNGIFEYDLFEMLINWGKFQSVERGDTESTADIKSYLKGIENLIDFSKMDQDSLHRCMQLCPGFFTVDEVYKLVNQKRNNLDNRRLRATKAFSFAPKSKITTKNIFDTANQSPLLLGSTGDAPLNQSNNNNSPAMPIFFGNTRNGLF